VKPRKKKKAKSRKRISTADAEKMTILLQAGELTRNPSILRT